MTSDSIGSPSYGALTVRSWYDNGVSEGNANVTFCNSHSTFQIWDMAMFEVSMESQGAALKDGMLGMGMLGMDQN